MQCKDINQQHSSRFRVCTGIECCLFYSMQSMRFLTYLQGIFHSSHPIELLSTLELIRTPIGQAGIQPAESMKNDEKRKNAREGKVLSTYYSVLFIQSRWL